MLGRKNGAIGKDKSTRRLQASGVYSIGRGPHPYIVDAGTVDAVKEKRIYGFWPGVWYVSVLSVLLFWLPPFGQMIAGYVGGRKAGTPGKGMLAAFAPMSLLFLLFLLRCTGRFVPEIDWLLGLPGAGAGYMAQNLPVLGPVVGFVSDYGHAFVRAMLSQEVFIYPYVLTVISGYVGGILSLQHRAEMEASGQEHPFVQVTAAPGLGDREAAAPAQSPDGGIPVVMGRIPDNWHMKKDRKKGKW